MTLGEGQFPADRFDDAQRGRLVGVHRKRVPKRHPWRTLLIFLLMTGLFIGVGLIYLEATRFEAEEVLQPAQTLEPIVTDPTQIDPALAVTITVLDATGGQGQTASDTLTAAGWPVVATLTATPADETTVFYNSEALAPVARGIAAALGVEQIQLETAEISGSPITVVVGLDAVPAAAPTTDDTADA